VENIEELISKLAQDSVTTNPAPHPFVLSLKWVGWAVGYIFLSLMISGLRPDIMIKLHEPWFGTELTMLTGIFIATALSAALLSFPDMHQMRRIAFLPVIAFALFVLVMLLAWHADNPPAHLPVHSFECTVSIIVFSVLPAVWTFFEMRKFASTHYHWAGGIALLSAFSVGALWLRLHEVNDSIMHVVQWHYLPMIAIGITGLWLGKVMLKW
jgi:hypothetical protein